ncbi:uncharacterized protein LOC135680995 [Rhopilema esculentum]|uniref:uncharacterized protein LOC135680995 n=1 Tax=Rhopilema esculentum TaxID=499914 RepID=UPI0031E16479|eukprot:gene5486-661_t
MKFVTIAAIAVLICFGQAVDARQSKKYMAKAKISTPKMIENPLKIHLADSKDLTEEDDTHSGSKREGRGRRGSTTNVNVKSCNANFCDPGWEPYPNIVSAMTGYNILKGNAYNFGTEQDPGFDNGYIFVPVVKDNDDRYTLHDGVTVRAISKCDLTLTTMSISTVKAFQKMNRKIEGMHEGWKTNPPVEVSFEGKGVRASAELPPLFEAYGTANLDQRKNEEFFVRRQGVLTVSAATCALYSMRISRRFPPPFKSTFQNAVKALSEATESDRKKEFHRFIQDFGTHFLQQATIGARLSILRRYSRATFQNAAAETIENCSKGRLSYFYFKEEGKNNCSKLDNAGKSTIFNDIEREYIGSYGSKPEKSLNEWASQEFDYPVPIRMNLVPIIELFHDDFMKHDEQLKNLDYSGMKQWMTPMYESYCEDVKGELGIAHCKPGDVRKCGYNDNCNPAYQDCIQKSAREFQCVTRITKTYMETKLKDTIKPIEGDMKAKDVLKMIEESEIGSLHGVEVYIIVMASSYGEMGVAGDNAVMVTYESFRVALAWANTEDVGEDAKLQSDTEKQRDKLCPEDATGSSSLNSIIANIKLLGHNVKFFVLAREPSGRHDENIAISTMRPDTFIDGRCDRSAKSVKVMTGPGAGGIPG